jgi:DNA-binding transcriptional ArsR family regulator
VARRQADDIFRAIADSTRRELINALLPDPRSFQELVALTTLTKSAVSQHLRVLIDAHVVTVDERDRERRYVLMPHALQDVDDFVAPYRQFWTMGLDTLGDAMRRHSTSRKPTAGH